LPRVFLDSARGSAQIGVTEEVSDGRRPVTGRRKFEEATVSESIRLTSRLPAHCLPALEALVFFNARQFRLRAQIEATVERFGAPKIVAFDGWLRVQVEGLPDVQCLYAVRGEDDEPVGVVVYIRDSIDRITVMHLSVASDITLHLNGGARLVLYRLLQQIHRVARCTKGISRVELAYKAAKTPQTWAALA